MLFRWTGLESPLLSRSRRPRSSPLLQPPAAPSSPGIRVGGGHVQVLEAGVGEAQHPTRRRRGGRGYLPPLLHQLRILLWVRSQTLNPPLPPLSPHSLLGVSKSETGCAAVALVVFGGSFGYASLERQRQRLPVYKYRKAILYLVERHATTIVVGETGSGKSTQIPQVLSQVVFNLTPRGV